jgi:hypothetical protein
VISPSGTSWSIIPIAATIGADPRQVFLDRTGGHEQRADGEDDQDAYPWKLSLLGRAKTGGRGPITLGFEILPPGERTDEHVRTYYREAVSRGRLRGFSQDRLDKMLTLPRSNWKKGKAGFYGYIVLMFDHTEKVVLECPVYGNAIYVLDSGEERLLRMTKQELKDSGEATVIPHSKNWYRRLKDELAIE